MFSSYLKDAEKQDIETQEIENRNDNKNTVINNVNNKIIMSSLQRQANTFAKPFLTHYL